MSRRSYTTVQLSVKMRLPPGSTQKDAIALIINSLRNEKEAMMTEKSQNPITAISLTEITVELIRKETVYL